MYEMGLVFFLLLFFVFLKLGFDSAEREKTLDKVQTFHFLSIIEIHKSSHENYSLIPIKSYDTTGLQEGG
jgi:hypothetical protein